MCERCGQYLFLHWELHFQDKSIVLYRIVHFVQKKIVGKPGSPIFHDIPDTPSLVVLEYIYVYSFTVFVHKEPTRRQTGIPPALGAQWIWATLHKNGVSEIRISDDWFGLASSHVVLLEPFHWRNFSKVWVEHYYLSSSSIAAGVLHSSTWFFVDITNFNGHLHHIMILSSNWSYLFLIRIFLV